jgi:hypothetical protein
VPEEVEAAEEVEEVAAEEAEVEDELELVA